MRYHVLVGTHHKTGTVWMASVFREISKRLAVPYLDLNNVGVPWRDTAKRRDVVRDFISQAHGRVIVFEAHSHFPDLSAVNPQYKAHFRGLHMIRDPRDVAISAASYHATASEPWLRVPQAKFGGLSYQEKNRSFPTVEEKILFELDNANRRIVRQMVTFENQGVFRDVKYEDMIEDTKLTAWQEILSYLGFEESEMTTALEAVWANSLFGGKQNHGAHITSGAIEQWRHVFDADLLTEYTNRFGAELVKLGYPLATANDLTPCPKLSEQPETADASSAMLFSLRDQIQTKLKKFEQDKAAYGRLVHRLRGIIATHLPPTSIFLIVTKGNELTTLGARRGWHFPQTEDGLYWDGKPADSADAISRLESLRQKGAGFLLFPNTAFWWLDHYSEFRRHLDSRYQRIADNDDCIIYDLQHYDNKPYV
jgi:hypothetical protein